MSDWPTIAVPWIVVQLPQVSDAASFPATDVPVQTSTGADRVPS